MGTLQLRVSSKGLLSNFSCLIRADGKFRFLGTSAGGTTTYCYRKGTGTGHGKPHMGASVYRAQSPVVSRLVTVLEADSHIWFAGHSRLSYEGLRPTSGLHPESLLRPEKAAGKISKRKTPRRAVSPTHLRIGRRRRKRRRWRRLCSDAGS